MSSNFGFQPVLPSYVYPILRNNSITTFRDIAFPNLSDLKQLNENFLWVWLITDLPESFPTQKGTAQYTEDTFMDHATAHTIHPIKINLLIKQRTKQSSLHDEEFADETTNLPMFDVLKLISSTWPSYEPCKIERYAEQLMITYQEFGENEDSIPQPYTKFYFDRDMPIILNHISNVLKTYHCNDFVNKHLDSQHARFHSAHFFAMNRLLDILISRNGLEHSHQKQEKRNGSNQNPRRLDSQPLL